MAECYYCSVRHCYVLTYVFKVSDMIMFALVELLGFWSQVNNSCRHLTLNNQYLILYMHFTTTL